MTFSQLQQAYSVLCDPEQRVIYDRQYVFVQTSQRASHSKSNATQQRDTPTNSPTPEYESAQAQQSRSFWEKKLKELLIQKSKQHSDLFEETRKANKLKADIKKLKDEANQDATTTPKDGGWWTYWTSVLGREASRAEEERIKRQNDQLNRSAAQIVKEHMLGRQEVVVDGMRDELKRLDVEIDGIRNKIQRTDREFQERAARQKQAEADQAAYERAQKENESKLREQLRAQMERRAAQAAENTRRQKEKDEAERRTKFDGEARKQRQRNSNAQNTLPCRHRAFWTQVEGSQLCSQCLIKTRKFAFECPRCGKVACATCREILKKTLTGINVPFCHQV